MDQPGKVANSARGQLNRENEYSPHAVHIIRYTNRYFQEDTNPRTRTSTHARIHTYTEPAHLDENMFGELTFQA